MEGLLIEWIEIDPGIAFQVADIVAHGRFFRRNLFQFFLGHGIDAGRAVMDQAGQVVHAVLLVILELVDRFDHIKGNIPVIQVVCRIVQHGLAFGIDRRIAQDFLADEHDARYVLYLIGAVEEMGDLFFRRIAVVRRTQDDVKPVVRNGPGISTEDAKVDVAQARHDAFDSGHAVLAVGHDLHLVIAQAGLEVRYDFIEIQVLLALGLANEVVVIRLVRQAELGIIEIGAEFRHQRQFAALSQFVEGCIVNSKARHAGIAAHLESRVEVVAVVPGHDDDSIVIHSLFYRHRLVFYGIALYAHDQRTDEADEDGQYHRQHTAFIHICHSFHLIYELLTWPWMVRRPSRMVTLSGWIPRGKPAKS